MHSFLIFYNFIVNLIIRLFKYLANYWHCNIVFLLLYSFKNILVSECQHLDVHIKTLNLGKGFLNICKLCVLLYM